MSRMCLYPRLRIGLVLVVLCVAACTLVFGLRANADQPNDYRLGPEDVILVTVVGHPEFSGEFLVPTDGSISFPRAGEIQVSERTPLEVAELVASNLRSTLRNPEVSVTLRQARAQTVYVTGSVQRPGPHDLKPGWRVSDAIGAAGGLIQGITAADCTVSTLSPSGVRSEPIPFQDAISSDVSKNRGLEPGDLISVESVDMIPVYVMGRVNRPGTYNIRKDSAGVLEVIAAAGGVMDDAALSKVTVTHINGESETISILPITTEGKQQDTIKLRSGDLVVVPDAVARFAVLGWVNAPGSFIMKENQRTTLVDALALARGVEIKRGGLGRVAILRTVDGKQERLVCDVSKFTKKGDSTQNPDIKPGDIIWVPETGKLNWERILSSVTSVLSSLWYVDRWSQ